MSLDLAESATPPPAALLAFGIREPLRARSVNVAEAGLNNVFLTPAKQHPPHTPMASLSKLRGTRVPCTPREEAMLLRNVSSVLKEHLQSVETARGGCVPARPNSYFLV